MTECNAFNFETTDKHCSLARNVIDVDNFEGNVYIRKSVPLVSIELKTTDYLACFMNLGNNSRVYYIQML